MEWLSNGYMEVFIRWHWWWNEYGTMMMSLRYVLTWRYGRAMEWIVLTSKKKIFSCLVVKNQKGDNGSAMTLNS